MALSGSIQRNRRLVSDAVSQSCKGDPPGHFGTIISHTSISLLRLSNSWCSHFQASLENVKVQK